MDETKLKKLIEKISNGENVDISLFTDVQKEYIKRFINDVTKACKEITDFLVNNLIPIIGNALEKISLWFEKTDKRYLWNLYCQAVRKQEVKPLYIDKRRKIHIYNRSNC